MADEVEVKLPNGEWVKRTSENILEKELEYPMRCCWRNKDGKPCHAPMVPVHLSKPHPHIAFRQKNGEKVHILNCDYDERREAETSTHLDYRALGRTSEDIWKGMCKKPKRNNGKGKKSVEPDGGSGGDEETSGGAEPTPRPIQRKSAVPTSPEALVALLLELPIDKPYANTYVRDLIMDQRTIERFRSEGIPENAYVLVLAKRLVVEKRAPTANTYKFVFADCMYDATKDEKAHDCIQFGLNLFGEARDEMFKFLKLKGDNTYIVIFSRWKRDPANANTYFALDTDVDHIGRIRLPDDE